MQIKVKGQTCDIVSVTQLREDKAHSEHQSQSNLAAIFIWSALIRAFGLCDTHTVRLRGKRVNRCIYMVMTPSCSLYAPLGPACLSAPAQFVLRSVGVFTSVGWGIPGQQSAAYSENLQPNWSRSWHQSVPGPSSSSGWKQIFIQRWRKRRRNTRKNKSFAVCLHSVINEELGLWFCFVNTHK